MRLRRHAAALGRRGRPGERRGIRRAEPLSLAIADTVAFTHRVADGHALRDAHAVEDVHV